MLFLNKMYLLINQLKDIKASSFKIDGKHQIFVNSDNEVKVFNGQNLDTYSFEKPRVTIIRDCSVWIGDASTGKSVIYCDSKPKTTVDFLATTLRNINFFSTKDYFYPRVYLNGNLYAPQYARISKKDNSIVDLFSKNFGFNGLYLVVNDNSFISQDNEKIGLFDFENNIIWQHNYTDLLGSDYKGGGPVEITNINDKLYVCFGRTTFCIEIETGNVEHRYEDYFRIAEGNLLYGLKPTDKRTEFYITILNAKTQEIKRIDILDELKKHNIHTDSKFIVQNGLIFFTQSMGDIVSKVGILDPNTEKLIWKHEFPKGSGQVGSLQVQGNRIYVHTQDKTLHIFEKE